MINKIFKHYNLEVDTRVLVRFDALTPCREVNLKNFSIIHLDTKSLVKFHKDNGRAYFVQFLQDMFNEESQQDFFTRSCFWGVYLDNKSYEILDEDFIDALIKTDNVVLGWAENDWAPNYRFTYVDETEDWQEQLMKKFNLKP